MHPYRVFVSYSHEDRAIVERLVACLKRGGLRPMWDRNIRPGDRFSDVIKHGIAHAHVFMPVLTAEGVKRPWVHQETGYAMGLEVPVLPVAVGQLPSEMLADLHAMRVAPDFTDLATEALGEPRLFTDCPHCRQPLRFNPFVHDFKEKDEGGGMREEGGRMREEG